MNRTCRVATTSASLYNYSMAGNLCETPLKGRCLFLTMTQTLHTKMGCNPFGPGLDGEGFRRPVPSGRVGLLRQGGASVVGEQMLSACSEQILTIQTGLRKNLATIEI
eukprot:g17924.t1